MKHAKRLFYLFIIVCLAIGLMIPSIAGTKKPGKPTIIKVESTNNNAGTVTFNAVSRAKGYQVQFAQNSKFSKAKKTVTTSNTTVTKTGLTGGKKYYVRVRAYVKNGRKTTYGSWSSAKTFTVKTIPTPGTPSISSISSPGEGVGLVSFNATANTTKYEIQFAQNSKFSKSRKTITTTSTSARKIGLSAGKKYYVRVRAFNGSKAGTWSKTKTFTVKKLVTPGTPSISSVTSKSNGSGTVTFNKASNATKYEIQFALNSSFTSGKKSATVTGTSATLNNLSVEKKYYVRVRAYNINKAGSWSKSKTVSIIKAHTHNYQLTECTVTCTSAGKNVYKCSCGASYTTNASAKGHSWSVYNTEEPINCIDGSRTYKCKNCGTTKTDVIKASMSHKFSAYYEDENMTCYACSNCGTLGDTVYKEQKVPEAAKYSYEIKILNPLPVYSSVIYNNRDFARTKVAVFIKTNNPNPTDLTLGGDIYCYTGEPEKYADLSYEKIVMNSINEGFFKVKNGYVFVVRGPEKPGKYTIRLETLSENYTLKTVEFTALDGLQLAKDEVQNIVKNSNITDNMTLYEKCLAVANYMSSTYKYHPMKRGSDLTSNDCFISLISHQGLIFQTKELMCTESHEIYKYIVENYFGAEAAADPQVNHTATRVYMENGKYEDSHGKYFVFESSPTTPNFVDNWTMIDPS